MRLSVAVSATLALIAAATPALAQNFVPPRAFPGYGQPEIITATACRAVTQAQTTCTIPPMTAGRYRARATGTSTSQGEGAVQALSIQIGTRTCGRIDNKTPWPSGPRTVRLDCEMAVLTDQALAVTVNYADAKAAKDPRGPTLVLERLPWDGVLEAQVSAPKQ
jgi:hypothetical protein